MSSATRRSHTSLNRRAVREHHQRDRCELPRALSRVCDAHARQAWNGGTGAVSRKRAAAFLFEQRSRRAAEFLTPALVEPALLQPLDEAGGVGAVELEPGLSLSAASALARTMSARKSSSTCLRLRSTLSCTVTRQCVPPVRVRAQPEVAHAVVGDAEIFLHFYERSISTYRYGVS